MPLTRRALIRTAAATPALAFAGRWSQAVAAGNLKISHQFPGGSIDDGDFRDRLVRRFAAEVKLRTKGGLNFDIYPGSSLMKTNAQFSALRKGALDLTLFPLSYAGGELPETNIGLMPGLVSSYDVGLGWKKKPIGQELTKFLFEKGVIIVTWIWQAGGVASREKPLVHPADAKGMKVRGGSREMDLVLQAAGAAVLSLPSSELYAAMQTGACDAGITSSTSLISFRLEELSKQLTAGRDKTYWFMLEPLLMSRKIFEDLPKDQQAVIMDVGAEMEKFGRDQAVVDDVAVAQIYAKAGAKVQDMNEAVVEEWRAIARDTAWKDYAGKNALSARLIKMAEEAAV